MLNSGYDFNFQVEMDGVRALMPDTETTQRDTGHIKSKMCTDTGILWTAGPPCSSARVATESVLTTPWVRGVVVLGARQLPVLKPPVRFTLSPPGDLQSPSASWQGQGAVLLALWFHARAKEIPAESRNGRVMLFLYHHCPRGLMTLEDASARSIIGAASAARLVWAVAIPAFTIGSWIDARSVSAIDDR